jgi:hypothetical protein
MPFAALLGRTATLPIVRFGSPGAFLALKQGEYKDGEPTILLLGGEIPVGATEGDELLVFVYKDSEGRPLATISRPKLELDEVAFLEVTAHTDFGCFVDWGLPKQLLVPFAEQTADMNVGATYAVGLYLDPSGRLAGTMRVTERLRARGEFEQDEWVMGEAWRNDPDIGLFVIVERTFVALVPRSERHTLSRGQSARFRVSNILEDGKIELSLRGRAHEELDNDAAKILAVLAKPGTPTLGDHSSPEAISRAYGLSKKAFKRAVGRLLKQGAVIISPDRTIALSGK